MSHILRRARAGQMTFATDKLLASQGRGPHESGCTVGTDGAAGAIVKFPVTSPFASSSLYECHEHSQYSGYPPLYLRPV